MPSVKKISEINCTKIEELLVRENRFISDFFSRLCIPKRDDDSEEEQVKEKNDRSRIPQQNPTSRAKSLQELEERLKAITSKKKLSYKEKLAKKGLKNRMKKKVKQDERNAKQKLLRAQKAMSSENQEQEQNENDIKDEKVDFDSEGKMVFSKIHLPDAEKPKKKKKKDKKLEKDPKKLLEKLNKQKEKIEELAESGEISKAVEIKEKAAWKNALAKAEGKKVKDDPTLLKKSIHKKEQRQKSSKKKWQQRQQGVMKAKEEKQRKRTENIQKRKKDKKMHKLKRASKKGRIIPGF